MKITVKLSDGSTVKVTQPYYCTKSIRCHFYMFISKEQVIQVHVGTNAHIGIGHDSLPFSGGDYRACTKGEFESAYGEVSDRINRHVLGIKNMPEINEAKEALMEEIDREIKPKSNYTQNYRIFD
jgi:hypothetical protein